MGAMRFAGAQIGQNTQSRKTPINSRFMDAIYAGKSAMGRLLLRTGDFAQDPLSASMSVNGDVSPSMTTKRIIFLYAGF